MSSGARSFIAILKADLLDRNRSHRFWISLALIAIVIGWCLPPLDARYIVLGIDGHIRGRYSSAWIGLVLAFIASCWLSLVGFYLARGSLTRDIDSQVWQLLVATPMKRRSYLLAKWCSHLLAFVSIVAVGAAIGVAAQLIRAEDRHVDLVELAKPIALLGLPALALTAMVSIWFDMIPALRSTVGNLLYFVIWIAALIFSIATLRLGAASTETAGWVNDPIGLSMIARDVTPMAETQTHAAIVGKACLGCGGLQEAPLLFDWSYWPTRLPDVLGRMFWFVVAVLGVLLAAPFLDRAAARPTNSTVAAGNSVSGRQVRWLTRGLAPIQSAGSLCNVVVAELLLVLRRRQLLWWLAIVISFAAQLLAPSNFAALAAMVGWILSLDIFSRAILREYESNTTAIVFSAANADRLILLGRWLMTSALAFLLATPALLRFATNSLSMCVAILAVGFSIATWGLALGALTRNSRIFEVLICVLAYLSTQGIPALNVAVAPLTTALWHLSLLPLSIAILLIAWPKLRTAY